MPTEEERQQAEVLSQEIDNLTIEGPRAVVDPEVAGFLAVADMMKHDCSGDEIPHSLIAGMADRLSAELKTKREQRRRHRLYTVLAGSAAAVVLAVGVQLTLFQQNNNLPPAEHLEAQVTPPPALTDKAAGEPDRTVPGGEPTAQEKAPATQPDRGSKTQIAAALLPDTVLNKLNEVAGEAKEEEKSGQLAMSAADVAAEKPQQETRLMAKARLAVPAGEEKSGAEQTITHLLVLPGRTAQSVTVAPDRKLVEQVYKMNGRGEIRVIQRLPGALSVTDAAGAASRQSGVSAAKDKVNRVTVTRDGYEVMVEGRQTTAELKKLADSLVIREAMP